MGASPAAQRPALYKMDCMLTTRTVFAQELRKLINQAIEGQKDDLAFGAAIATVEQYRERVGLIRGLVMARDFCDTAEEAADARERGEAPQKGKAR